MKVFRDGDTFIAPRGSYFEGNVRINGDFIVPPDTHFWGHLVVDGNLELGPNSSIKYKLTCQNAVIGAKVRIGGDVNVEGSITVCDNTTVKNITAGGNVVIRPGVTVGDVKCGGTLYVFGKVKSGKLYGKQVKILRDPYPRYYEEPEEEEGAQAQDGQPRNNPGYSNGEYENEYAAEEEPQNRY